jgi:hypothetical protein
MRYGWIFAFLGCAWFPGLVAAQAEPPPGQMQQLQFLIGHWHGQGWRLGSDGTRQEFMESEVVQARASGAVLSIEGTGTGVEPSRRDLIVHSAFGTVSYDRNLNRFRWCAITSGGDHVETEPRVGDRELVWELAIPGGPTTRYTIRVNPQGQWVETGEVSSDAVVWQQVFAMTLDRCE